MLPTGPRGVLVLAFVLLACRGGSRQDARAAASTAATAAALRETAPAAFRVRFETSAGSFTVAVHRDWAPLGADRFYNLARSGYFDGVRFFRVLPGFVAQFGMHGDPAVTRAWFTQRFPDDPVRHTNARGTVTFATSGPDSRTTQLFINYGDNAPLDARGFAPLGEVVEGMEVVDRFYAAYGEGAPQGRGPDQGRIRTEGNAYLERDYPRLDYVKRATVLIP